ncbi:MAG: hypothetical protein KDD33_09800 [Bdellovibrionales bacterium]|nr:hypothetical protein [Bdellovibrionales bacterium]
MKILIATLTILMSLSAFANNIPFEDGEFAMYATSGKAETFYKVPNCPAGSVCGAATTLTLTFNAGGCLDRVVTFDKVTYDYGEQIFNVYVTALNIQNKDSLVANCFAMPMVTKDIVLGQGYIPNEKVLVHFIGTNVVMTPQAGPGLN